MIAVPAIKTKAELLKAIRAERRLLEALLAEIDPARFGQAGVCGKWSIKDLMAHLAAWEQTFIRWYAARDEMTDGLMPPEVQSTTSVKVYNKQLFEQYRDWNLTEVQTFFQQSFQQIIALVEQIPESDLFTSHRYPWTGKWTLKTFVAANTNLHYSWARTQINRWRKEKGIAPS